MRINLNISDSLLEKIDKKCKELYLSRTAYITTACVYKLQLDETIESLPEVLKKIDELRVEK